MAPFTSTFNNYPKSKFAEIIFAIDCEDFYVTLIFTIHTFCLDFAEVVVVIVEKKYLIFI